MTRWVLTLLVAAAALGSCLRSNHTQRRRQAERDIEKVVDGASRFVDMGVVLRVVRMDLENGKELLAGQPPLVVLREHRRGGVVDTAAVPPHFIGPSRAPVVWYCGEDAEDLILHPDTLPDRLLVYGSEGAGKTTAQAMWAGLRMLEFTGEGREIGLTAPTEARLDHLYKAITKLWPASWYRYVGDDGCFYVVNNTTVRLVSTHQQSSKEGSRVQGYNWSAHGGDEMQDQIEYDGDIEMRGRSANRGRYKRFNTCTAKDAPGWRSYRDRVLSKPKHWALRRLIGPRSPFVWPSVWEDRKDTLSEREYKRRVLAQDVGPERMLYSSWERGDHDSPGNLRPVPPNAVDVTSEVLAKWGPNLTVLVGHDPGKLFDVSIFLKAFRLPRNPKLFWWVVGEVTTEQSTTETHVMELLRYARERWHVNTVDWKGRPVEGGPRMLVRADPYSDSGASDSAPSRSVYTIFRQAGILIHAAAYVAKTNKIAVGKVPKEGRIEMMNTLLHSAKKERRLFVDCDDRRQPVAPSLVEALETSERDEAGKAEAQRKDRRDMSHWPAAAGYALWVLERPRMYEETT